MRINFFSYSIILVLLLFLVSSCAPLPTPASQPQSAPLSSNSADNSSPNIVSNSYWQSFLDITIYPKCGTKREIVPFTVSQSNPASEIIEAWTAKNQDWIYAPDSDGYFSLLIQIGSKSDKSWVELKKTISIEVKAKSISDQTATAFRFPPACGEGRNIREFSSFTLETNFEQYLTKTSSKDFDFFTLQPGEWETFHVPFHCTEPGYYNITAQIEFQYENNNGLIEVPLAQVSCPYKFTVYTIDGIDSTTAVVTDLENYEWSNGHYK